jgi:thermitase
MSIVPARAAVRAAVLSTVGLGFALAGAPATPAAAADAVAPDTVLVHPSGARGAHALATSPDVAGTVAQLPGGARLVRVDGDPRAVAARLKHRRGISWAEPNVLLHASAVTGTRASATPSPELAPDDPLLGQQPDLAAIHAPYAWTALNLGGFPDRGGVHVGIVDTGIDAGHEDLAGRVAACGTAQDGKVAAGSCADDEGHGTHVAGTIGARTGNGAGIAGIAFDSPLMVCRALTADGGGTTADVAACVAWLHDQGAKVISMSLGGPASKTLAAAVTQAYARGGRGGSLIVAAAGNDGNTSVEYPAGLPQVVSVAAVDDAGAHAPFSNSNADVELAAPGVDVLSARIGGGYVRESGTSMATPHVAGAAALIWSADPSASASTIRTRLDHATVDAGAPGRDPDYGFGRLDLSHQTPGT